MEINKIAVDLLGEQRLGLKLVAEQGVDPYHIDEIYIGVEDQDGIWGSRSGDGERPLHQG